MESDRKLKVILGEPSVVAVSEPGEKCWGTHQFPQISQLDDKRLAVTYSMSADSCVSYGLKKPVVVSDDGGRTWQESEPDVLNRSSAGAIVFPDGEAIKFPEQRPLDASKLNLPEPRARDTDLYGRKSDCYRLEDLPKRLQQVKLLRWKAKQSEWVEESVRLDIPDLVVRVFRWEWSYEGWLDPNLFIQPRITHLHFWTMTPDNGILIFQYHKRFNKDGTVPVRTSVMALRSDDRGRTWRLWGVPGYFANEEEARCTSQPYLDDPDSNYNRLWGGKDKAPIPNFATGGLYEPGVVLFNDGRMVCVMRSCTGATHEPMFLSRSEDWGKTWTQPEILTPFGVVPRLVLLDKGVIAMVYGRPGVQLLFCTDSKGKKWHTPINLIPEREERSRQSLGRRGMVTTPTRAGCDDTCGNCTVLKTGPDRFLIAYSDFRYKNKKGQRCKAIKVQDVIVKVEGVNLLLVL